MEGAEKNQVVDDYPDEPMETSEQLRGEQQADEQQRDEGESQDKPIMTKVREYLAKRKQDQPSCSSQNRQDTVKEKIQDPAGTYSAIKKMNCNSLSKPNLNGMAEIKPPDVGSFYNAGDKRMNLAVLRTNYEKRINLSLSFDPTSKRCLMCNGENSHTVGGGGEVGNPRLFILSDQCCPPYVQRTNGCCPGILRIENGTLNDLAASFLDIFKGVGIGVGSVVLLSSASLLGAVGTAAYAEEFVRAARWLKAGLADRVDVRHGVPLLLAGVDSPHLIRSLHEVGQWLENLRDRRERTPSVSYRVMLSRLNNSPASQPDFESRVRLPVSLFQFESKIWASKNWVLPMAVDVMSEKTEEELTKALFAEIAEVHSIPLGEFLPVNRSPERLSEGEPVGGPAQSFVLVGASHARRLADALQESGGLVEVLNMPSHAPQRGTVETAAGQLEEVLSGNTKKHVIMIMLDNAAYFARTEEGSLIPARRGEMGSFHLDGELVVSPREMFSHTLKTCEPLFRLADKAASALLISPMPRYWLQPCCGDPDHAPNRKDEGFEDDLFTGLEGLRRHCKDYLFLHRHRNISVLNAALMLTDVATSSAVSTANLEALRDLWGGDPVHPSRSCYTNMAKKIMERTEASANVDGGSVASGAASRADRAKKPKWFEAPESSVVNYQPARDSWAGWREPQRGRGFWQRGGARAGVRAARGGKWKGGRGGGGGPRYH